MACHRTALRAALAAAVLLAGCAPTAIDDPIAELRTHPGSPRRQIAAMVILDAEPHDEAYLQELHRMIWVAGYTPDVREAALERLERQDLDGLKRTIRQRLPNMNAWTWPTRLCEIVGERGWTDLAPALVSSWARPTPFTEETERPEYRALVTLFGPDQVTDVVFDLMIENAKVWQEGFRKRCWTLLHRLGERERLAALLETATIAEDDAMLQDLRAGVVELGLIPSNKEEILWLRKLRAEQHAAFWSLARSTVEGLPKTRRAELEIRDLPIVVAAALHEPELLGASKAELLRRVESQLRGRKRYTKGSRFDAAGPGTSQRLKDAADRLTWGDLVAMLMANAACQVPEVVAHLHDYAERDRADTSTEYGGVIDLDAQGRFRVLEFPPRIRDHDQKFIATQAMFDAAYTALFHFHYHVQKVRNEEYAGPGYGDEQYADATRANCLVLTSVGEGRLNVDFYRHGRVLVDLGVMDRRLSVARQP